MVGRILIMDDEKYVRWALKEHLRGCGFSIFEASDTKAALEIMEGLLFDAVLLDVELLEHQGALFIQKFKNFPKQPHVFLVSKEDLKHHKNLALDWGARGFIKKPFRISEINELLEKVLRDVNYP
ncbi:MAG: KDP operon transcriptional regulatory protein KdpE [bacterium ADurb.BinA186]|nr:MAG: KDP operon transcriptional regulatory protein KdpE [bacterium ADurb.BinA186]